MIFPTATWREIRAVLKTQIATIPGARRYCGWALLLLIAGSAADVAFPLLLGRIVDAILGAASPAAAVGAVSRIGVGLAAVAIAAAVLSAAGFYYLAKVTEKVIALIREDMVGTALSLPAHRVEEAGSGDLVSRSTDDVAELSSAVSQTAPVVTKSLFAIGSTAFALIGLQWQFLLVVAAVAPVYYLACRRYLQVAPRRYAQQRAALAERARRVLESIRGLPTLRAYRWESARQADIAEASEEVMHLGLRARKTMMTLQAWIAFSEATMLLSGLAVGFYTVAQGNLSVGEVTAAMLLLLRLRGPLLGLMRVLDVVQSGYASLARIVGVIADPPAAVEPSGAPERRGDVRVRGVCLRYGQDGPPAVDNVSFDIPRGSTVALVGASGAGKSSVAATVAGLRVPDTGSVTIDGVEVSKLADAERVARLALISQEVYVFAGTLREDLQLAAPNADDEALLSALERVGAEWVGDLPDGLDTVVGARGLTLDPVAAQQLALARILLLDPKVVIMDEATAEAGSAGSQALDDAARAVRAGRTCLVVAHRLDQAYDADRILVMEAGKVIEAGSHSELLSYRGRYEQLWSAWQKGRGTHGD